jgi:predicted transcriptional regulator of viral defense system
MVVNEKSLHELFENSTVIRSRDFVKAGYSRIFLTRAVKAGWIKRIAPGLYSLPGFRQGEHGDLVLVASKSPEIVICLLSALRFHELTTQTPFDIWIAIENKSHPPRIEYPKLRVFRFAPASLEQGIEVRVIDGVPIRITSIEKTIADCFKFRSKVGVAVAMEALREAHTSKRLNQNELWKYAKIDRVANIILPYLEAIG